MNLRGVRWAILLACGGLVALAGCGGGGGAAGGGGGAPTVNVFPPSAMLQTGEVIQFRTSLENWSGGVTWAVNEPGGGSVNADGVYTAPDTDGIYTVIARSVIDAGIKGHAVVVVGNDPGVVDTSYDFASSPVQPGAMLLTPDTGCIRGKLLNRDLNLVPGVAMHLYRMTEAAGRAWEAGVPLPVELPTATGRAVRQGGGNSLEPNRATTTSTGYGFYPEPTSNYTFGTTPPGYYVITTEVVLPDGRRVEVLGAFARVFIGEDTVINVFDDQSPTVDSAELRPGQTRNLGQVVNAQTSYFIGKFNPVTRDLAEVPGAGTFAGSTFTAGNALGVYTAAVVQATASDPATGFAQVHLVGVRTRFPSLEIPFDGGPVVLSIAAVDGLAGVTATPVPTTAQVTGPDNFAAAVALTAVPLGATTFDPVEFPFPGDWQFFTGTVVLPPNLTAAGHLYTATVSATYGVAGTITETASTSVQALNQPANPPVVR